MKRWPGENLFAALFRQFLFAVPAGAVLTQLLFPGTVPSPDQLMAVAPMAHGGSVLFPGRAASLMMSEALVATVSATLLLPDETMTLMWAGAAIVLLAEVGTGTV